MDTLDYFPAEAVQNPKHVQIDEQLETEICAVSPQLVTKDETNFTSDPSAQLLSIRHFASLYKKKPNADMGITESPSGELRDPCLATETIRMEDQELN